MSATGEFNPASTGQVLTGHGITRCEKGSYALVSGVAQGFCAAVEMNDAERDDLPALCCQGLDADEAFSRS